MLSATRTAYNPAQMLPCWEALTPASLAGSSLPALPHMCDLIAVQKANAQHHAGCRGACEQQAGASTNLTIVHNPPQAANNQLALGDGLRNGDAQQLDSPNLQPVPTRPQGASSKARPSYQARAQARELYCRRAHGQQPYRQRAHCDPTHSAKPKRKHPALTSDAKTSCQQNARAG